MERMLIKVEGEMKKVNIKMHQANLMMEKASAEIVNLDAECKILKEKLTKSEIHCANALDRLEELGEDMEDWKKGY